MEHLRSEHARDVEEDDVEEIADMQDLQIEDSVECQCSLCLQAMPFSKFYDHTAGHLEDLALFVLNGASEDEEAALEDGDADSKAVVGLAHERQEKLSTSELEMVSLVLPVAEILRAGDADVTTGWKDSA